MENYSLRLKEVINQCCDVKTFSFEAPLGLSFKPGQYLILTLAIKGKDVPKAFSISSSPTEKGIVQFTKKLTTSDFSDALNHLALNEKYLIRLPMGKFTFDGEYPKVAFLTGGIGITPIRSICKNATDKRLASSLIVLYSSRTPEYLVFKNDFDMMANKYKNLKMVYTLTDCDKKVAGCREGTISEDMLKEEIPDYRERTFYICGPPGMVAAMRTLLNKLSIPPEKIIIEDFVGY